MKARQIARELALLSLSQIGGKESAELDDLVLASIRTLSSECEELLETASLEIKRGENSIFDSETRAADLESSKNAVREAMELARAAINRVGMAVELPEFLQLANQKEVRAYAWEILSNVKTNREEIDEVLQQSLVSWQLRRLPRIDRDLLRIAAAEMMYMGTPQQVAINECVEIAKRYSEEEGHRFINGILRRLSDRLRDRSVPTSNTSK
ncbi:transcription antitermination factor NusB [Geitlerinema sp. PCC 9228]|jgi:N utilization substance protein B|uniref:transcription antitermination factor NusB n=1 Tax=Geitlerinema sp. PCC 9228 TaxID=111611 RepID=UPI0008F9B00C|nr:transcription antitermination factor NusB [Geitlerinema sp. PCC 9228]